MISRLHIAAVLGLGLLACDPVNKPTMNPGQDCMACHCTGDASCTASRVPWTAAGTVFGTYDGDVNTGAQGVHVLITDALSRSVLLTTNEAGNFYTAEKLTPPLAVSIDNGGDDAGMITTPTPDLIYGVGVGGHGIGCNGCHQAPDFTTGVPPTPVGGGAPIGAPLGRIAIPGAPPPGGS